MEDNEVTFSQILNQSNEMENEDLLTPNRFSALDTDRTQVKNGNTENSSKWLTTQSKSKRRRGRDGSIDDEVFQGLSTGDKLNILFTKITNIEESQSQITTINEQLTTVNKRVHVLEGQSSTVNEKIEELSYKLLDMETRSRSSNLIVYGLEERSDRTTFNQVHDLLCNYLLLDPEEFCVESVSRLGRIANHRYNGPNRKRAVLVVFRSPQHVNRCMENCYRLAGSNIAVDRDYPVEIQQARKRLWPQYKRLRAQHKTAVKFVYPAAISVSGEIKFNEFPQWDKLLYGRKQQTAYSYIKPTEAATGTQSTAVNWAQPTVPLSQPSTRVPQPSQGNSQSLFPQSPVPAPRQVSVSQAKTQSPKCSRQNRKRSPSVNPRGRVRSTSTKPRGRGGKQQQKRSTSVRSELGANSQPIVDYQGGATADPGGVPSQNVNNG